MNQQKGENDRRKYFMIKSPLTPQSHRPVVYSTDHSKAVVPVLVLLFVALWFGLFYEVICFALYYFVLVFFSPLSIAITSLGEES